MLVKLKDKSKYILGLKNNEFELFLSKFYGTLTSRGRKSFAIKLFNKILLNFKNKFDKDPFIELYKATNNLVPLLTSTQKKIGKVYHSVPKLASGNRRFVIMLSWIIKKQKSKSNVLGIKIDDISRHLIDAVNNKGVLVNLKKQQLSVALAGKHLLHINKRRSFYKRKLKRKKKLKKFFLVNKFFKRKYSKKRLLYLKKRKLLFSYNNLKKN